MGTQLTMFCGPTGLLHQGICEPTSQALRNFDRIHPFGGSSLRSKTLNSALLDVRDSNHALDRIWWGAHILILSARQCKIRLLGNWRGGICSRILPPLSYILSRCPFRRLTMFIVLGVAES